MHLLSTAVCILLVFMGVILCARLFPCIEQMYVAEQKGAFCLIMMIAHKFIIRSNNNSILEQ